MLLDGVLLEDTSLVAVLTGDDESSGYDTRPAVIGVLDRDGVGTKVPPVLYCDKSCGAPPTNSELAGVGRSLAAMAEGE